MLLNCTTRKQVEKVLPAFLQRWPDAAAVASGDPAEIARLCRPLGFSSRRTAALQRMAEAYVAHQWQHVRELPGIGEYAARAWEIFCRGTVGTEPPKDHALVQYWSWMMKHG
jgi:methyl-CpG-binding domain protein 4